MNKGYLYSEELVDTVRRMIRFEYPTIQDWFALAVISNVDYKMIYNFMQYYPSEYRELMRVNKWRFQRYPSMLMLERIVNALGFDLAVSVVKRGT